jgi:hypothetical protein
MVWRTLQSTMTWVGCKLATEDAAFPPGSRFLFGDDSFVRRFAKELANGWVFAWRVLHETARTDPVLRRFLDAAVFQLQKTAHAPQCRDQHWHQLWQGPERGAPYNSELASSKPAKVGGRHYAPLHMRIPDDCLVIDQPHLNILLILLQKVLSRLTSWLSGCGISCLHASLEAAFVGEFDEPLLIHELGQFSPSMRCSARNKW